MIPKPVYQSPARRVYLHLSNFYKAEVLGKKAVDKILPTLSIAETLGGIYATLKRYPEAKETVPKDY